MDSIPSRRSDNTSQSSSCHIKSLYRWHMKIFHSINKLRIETKMKENNKGSLDHLKLRERETMFTMQERVCGCSKSCILFVLPSPL